MPTRHRLTRFRPLDRLRSLFVDLRPRAVTFSSLLSLCLISINSFALESSFQSVNYNLLTSTNPAMLVQQRQHYLSAREALRRGQMVNYRKYRDRLHGYPLAAYLDFFELNRKLRRLPINDVDKFLNDHPNTYVGDKLRQRWLHQLAKHSRWTDFLQYYDDKVVSSTSLKCRALYARHKTGDAQALTEVAELWNVEHSQPKECDNLFKAWITAGLRTPELNWDRFNKAIKARNRTLARYLAKSLEGQQAKLANLHLEVYSHPQRIRQRHRFQQQTPDMQSIILHGLTRYARHDPLTALYEWRRYDAQQLFDDQQRLATQQQLAMQLVKRGHQKSADQLVSGIAQITSDKVTEFLIRDALKQQDWSKIYRYLQHLPEQEQQSEKWLYWRARALEQLQITDPNFATPQQIYTQLAMERSYYSFLAADKLGYNYQLSDHPVTPAADVTLSIINHPATQRARELKAVGDQLNANREWLYMTSRFNSEDEHIAAAKLAHQWGWHHKTITSMASAKSWDDLRLRFPLAYNKHVFSAAQQHQVSPLLLFSIARQESAFAETAASPAGAMGLMQLMPRTARSTARKAGIKYNKRDLLKADTNIQLGSFYITELLNRYQGNRILAAAAYNAGPHRVDTWLKSSASNLPHDVWVETIPYKETRKYVQNVLAYSVIYGYRTGTTPAMLSPSEQRKTL